jgi:hypothetical protein
VCVGVLPVCFPDAALGRVCVGVLPVFPDAALLVVCRRLACVSLTPLFESCRVSASCELVVLGVIHTNDVVQVRGRVGMWLALLPVAGNCYDAGFCCDAGVCWDAAAPLPLQGCAVMQGCCAHGMTQPLLVDMDGCVSGTPCSGVILFGAWDNSVGTAALVACLCLSGMLCKSHSLWHLG